MVYKLHMNMTLRKNFRQTKRFMNPKLFSLALGLFCRGGAIKLMGYFLDKWVCPCALIRDVYKSKEVVARES